MNILLIEDTRKKREKGFTDFIDQIIKTLAATYDIPISELIKQYECDECHMANKRLIDEWEIIKTIDTINPMFVGPKNAQIRID